MTDSNEELHARFADQLRISISFLSVSLAKLIKILLISVHLFLAIGFISGLNTPESTASPSTSRWLLLAFVRSSMRSFTIETTFVLRLGCPRLRIRARRQSLSVVVHILVALSLMR